MIIRPSLFKKICASLLAVLAGITSARAQNGAATQPGSRPTLIIAYAEHLQQSADQWAKYREGDAGGGWNVVRHSVAPTTPENRAEARDALRQFIRDTYASTTKKPGEFAVLLLGDASDNSGQGIPVWLFPQLDPSMQSADETDYVSDHPYQVMNERSESPQIALGRVPAQTNDEALAALHKIQKYESDGSSLAGDAIGRNRITYIAGEGHFGMMDSILESLFKSLVDRTVPDSFDISMTYANPSSVYCPPPSQLTDTVLKRLSEGSLLFNYLGHGHATGFDSLYWSNKRFPILRVTDVKREPAPPANAQLPVAFMLCCSVGHYDLPKGAHSLAEELLFKPVGGVVAVIAGSRITHPYANTILQMDFTKTLLVDRAPTVGQLDLLAEQSLLQIDDVDRELDAIAAPIALAGKWKTSLKDFRTMHVKLYNLLGDPATRLPLRPCEISNLKYESGRISGTINGMKAGTVTIAAETARPLFAHPDKLDPVIGDNDPDLEKKAANNYPLANDRALVRFEAKVENGTFELTFPGPLPEATAVLRAYAAGTKDDGRRMDAIGALRIAPSTTQPQLTGTVPSR